MNEVWMLDYLHAVFPYMGVFPSEGHAWAWVERNDPDRKHSYKAFRLTVNHTLDASVYTTAPERRYANQR
jgi:hypothetical protein